MDFYIPKTPLHSKNIPNVNTYMNVFFISYIYKPATSSHPKPGLFETTTLTLLLTCSWIPLFMTSEPDFRRIPESPVSRSSWLRRFEIPDRCVFATPRLCRFKIPDYREFATSRLRRFEIPDHREFATSGFRRFQIPKNCKCFALEKHISRTLLNSTFRGWRVFLNSPTPCILLFLRWWPFNFSSMVEKECIFSHCELGSNTFPSACCFPKAKTVWFFCSVDTRNMKDLKKIEEH
jgi:hypothetical protein